MPIVLHCSLHSFVDVWRFAYEPLLVLGKIRDHLPKHLTLRFLVRSLDQQMAFSIQRLPVSKGFLSLVLQIGYQIGWILPRVHRDRAMHLVIHDVFCGSNLAPGWAVVRSSRLGLARILLRINQHRGHNQTWWHLRIILSNSRHFLLLSELKRGSTTKSLFVLSV
jgi:hypothetical protein